MNNVEAKISVIIPAYRAAEFIEEALQSIKAQTYLNWEIVVAEDGHFDQTADIVQTFARNCSPGQVILVKHPVNLGVGPARNAAMAAAHGDYFAFLDHDDHWDSHHLATAVSKLQSTGADLVYSTVSVFESGTKGKRGAWGPTAADLADFPNSLYGRNFIAPSGVVLRRSLYEKVGPFETRPDFQSVEDHDYWLRAITAGFRMAYSDKPSCNYRRGHASAATAACKANLRRDMYVLKKHRNMAGISKAAKNNGAAQLYEALGVAHLSEEPVKALGYFFAAWMSQPTAIRRARKCFGLAWKLLTGIQATQR